MGKLFGIVFFAGAITAAMQLIGNSQEAKTDEKNAKNPKLIAEWNLDTSTTKIADFDCDEKTLVIVDYMLSDEDGSYLGETTLTVFDKNSKKISDGTVYLENDVSTPYLLDYGKNMVYFMTSLDGKYFLTAYKLGKKGVEKISSLQFDSQVDASIMGNEVVVSMSSGPDENGAATLTVRVYNLGLSKMLKEFSGSDDGGYFSILPVGVVNKSSTWETSKMLSDGDGGISSINIKLMK